MCLTWDGISMFELLYIDGLVVIFRGMMGCQDYGDEQISAIGLVVYVILISEERACGGVWRCGLFSPYGYYIVCSRSVLD